MMSATTSQSLGYLEGRWDEQFSTDREFPQDDNYAQDITSVAKLREDEKDETHEEPDDTSFFFGNDVDSLSVQYNELKSFVSGFRLEDLKAGSGVAAYNRTAWIDERCDRQRAHALVSQPLITALGLSQQLGKKASKSFPSGLEFRG
jgi:hypothetical protein